MKPLTAKRTTVTTGTSVQLSADDGDIFDWALTWDQWKALAVT